MGGKSKQAHRTKNNVRPSSSGRSAELLGAGAGSLRAAAALFPSLAAAAAVPDAALLPDLALAIKKLNKKDPITKCKALQELTELVQNNKVEDVELMLPQWALLYRALAVDPDRKVRELTQMCHGHIVGACGRRVAPHLKALLPVWLQAQHDDFAPAQARAQHSLHSTFPGSKLPEAISFCRVEILQHLVDNLLDTDAAVSKKLEQTEEREAARVRVVCAALAGLRYVCGALPPSAQHDDWLWERLAPLLKAQAFWKLANHQVPELRAAWYGAAGALATRFGSRPQWAGAGGCGVRALKVVANARECGAGAGAAAGAAWRALLSLITNDPEWYDRLEKKELVMKQLLETLEGGGWGDARALAELLPRLLAALPPAALGAEAVGRLFTALFAGLGRRSVLLSPRERQAWLAAVGAAIQHVADRSQVPREAAAGGVRQWLQTALAARSEPLVRESAHCLAALLKHWTTEQPGAELLVRGLWQALASTAGAQLAQLADGEGGGDGGGGAGGVAAEDTLRHLLAAHVLLLLTLRAALLQEQPKKRRGIRFEDEPTATEDPDSERTDSRPDARPTSATSASARLHHHHLEEAAQRMVASYLEFAGTRTSRHVDIVLEGLLPLLTELGSRELWTGVGRALCGARAGAEADAGPTGVWERVLRPWLSGAGGGGGGRGDALVDVTLLLLPHLTADAQADVFAAVDRAGEPVSECVVRKCIQSGGAGAGAVAEATRGWVRGAGARAAVLRLLARALRGDEGAARVVCDCIGDRDTEPPAGADTSSCVLAAASAALTNATPAGPASPAARVCAQLLARARPSPAPAPVPATAPGSDSYDQLILALFRYDLHSQVEREDEEESVVRSSWRGALRILLPARAEQIVSSAVSLIKEYLNVETTDLQTVRMKHAATSAALLAEFKPAAAVARDVTAAVAWAGAGEARAAVAPHALRSACIAGRLCCPFDDVEPVRSMVVATECALLPDRALVVRHGRECVLRGALLRAWTHTEHFDELTDMFAELLYDCAIVHEMSEGYAFWSGYHVIERIQADLTGIVDEILAAAPDTMRRATLAVLRRRAACHGHWWAWAHARYRLPLQGAGEVSGEEVDPDLTGDGFFHTLQAELINEPTPAARYAASYCAIARCLLAQGALDGDGHPALAEAASSREPDPDLLINAYYRRNEILLFDTDVSAAAGAAGGAGWSAAVCTASACDFLAALVEHRGWDAPAHWWDFVTIALASVLASLRRAKAHWGDLQVSLLTAAAERLYGAVGRFVASVPAEAERRAPSAHVAALPREWADVFEPEVVRCLYEIVLHVLESTEQAEDVPISVSRARALSALCGAVRRAPYGAGAGAVPLAQLASGAAGVLGRVAPHAHKYLAFYTLRAITDPLVLHDAASLREWSSKSENSENSEGSAERPALALDWLWPALAGAAPLVDAALAHVPPADHVCELIPHTDSHSLALGYLLLVCGVGGLAGRARGDLALHYAELIRSHELPQPALTAALRLVPAGVCEYAADPSSSAVPPRQYNDAFLTVKEFSIDEPSTSSDVSLLACRALYLVVGGAGGGAARSWWGAAEARAARAFARLVAAYVTPPLVRDQLRGVHTHQDEIEDSEVSVHWSAGEVTCALLVDERKVELNITLAKDHPLTLPKVSTTSQCGGSTQWLCVYLAYQQGSLVGALKLWAAAVSARVDAARPCYICYCRLQPASGRLPSAPCHQCRNKFHPECLRKWFTTSNKSNCPLCRASF